MISKILKQDETRCDKPPPGRDQEHGNQVPGDLIDHDRGAVLASEQNLGAARGPGPDQDDQQQQDPYHAGERPFMHQ